MVWSLHLQPKKAEKEKEKLSKDVSLLHRFIIRFHGSRNASFCANNHFVGKECGRRIWCEGQQRVMISVVLIAKLYNFTDTNKHNGEVYTLTHKTNTGHRDFLFGERKMRWCCCVCVADGERQQRDEKKTNGLNGFLSWSSFCRSVVLSLSWWCPRNVRCLRWEKEA